MLPLFISSISMCTALRQNICCSRKQKRKKEKISIPIYICIYIYVYIYIKSISIVLLTPTEPIYVTNVISVLLLSHKDLHRV